MPLRRQATYRLFGGLLLYPEPGRIQNLKSAAKWLRGALPHPASPYKGEEGEGTSRTNGEVPRSVPLLCTSAQDGQVPRNVARPGRPGNDRGKEGKGEVEALLARIASLNGNLQDGGSAARGQEPGAANLQSLQSDYVRLFRSSPRGFCYPYEGAYTDPEKAAEMSFRLECEYAVAGLKLSVKDFPDHAATELEFMSFLCGHEVEWAAKAAPTRTSAQDGQVPRNVALPGGQGNDRGRGGLARPEGLIEGKDHLHRIRSRQLVFLRGHLSRWFPAFVSRVSESGNEFYTWVCRGAADFIAIDKSYLERRS